MVQLLQSADIRDKVLVDAKRRQDDIVAKKRQDSLAALKPKKPTLSAADQQKIQALLHDATLLYDHQKNAPACTTLQGIFKIDAENTEANRLLKAWGCR